MKNVGTIVVETSRLLLRRFVENDAQELCEGFVNQKSFLYYANKSEITIQEEIDLLKKIKGRYEDLSYYNWLITLKENKKLIGSINLRINKSDETAEISYAIDERYTGNGYMTEAMMAVSDLCLNTIMVKRLYGGCEIDNIASRKVLEKCGFTCKGIIKNHLKLSDGFHDMYLFVIEK